MPQLPLPMVMLLALGLVVLLAVLLTFLRTPAALPYTCRPEFLTAAELVFFRALEAAVAGKFYVVAKVRIGDLVYVVEGTENVGAWCWKIGQKHVGLRREGKKE